MSLTTSNTGMVSHIAVCGIGLWVALDHSSTVSLYHTESFIHMQDINIASNVSRALGSSNKRSIYVTALSAAKGLLWVGTNVGIALTIPLPRLEGVPIISGKANISYHAHFGPVRMFLPLQPRVATGEASPAVRRPVQYRKQMSDSVIPIPASPGSTPHLGKSILRSKSVVSTRQEQRKSSSKTLPRGFTIGPGSESSGESVFGLYGDLMNVGDYDTGSGQELEHGSSKEIHKSDPDLDTIPYRIGTLDRRVEMKSQRPRSLDLSSWSVESRASSQCTSSSSGTDSHKSPPASPAVSRTASCASDSTSNSSWQTRSEGSGGRAGTLTKEPG